jgi:histidinol phosphatase-like enzyme (inositol monophosphatase family)
MSVDRALLDIAIDITKRAGEMTLGWFQSPTLSVERKRDGTPVTEADRAAETFIRRELRRHFPDDAIIGEEFPAAPGTTGRTWYVDPIDGTKAFSHGVPLYSNLLAMTDADGSAIGVVNIPALSEVVAAGRALGCFHNGRSCRVSTTSSLADAYVSTSGLGYWPPEPLSRLLDSPCTIRTWGDGYGYVLVATGRVDAMIDPIVATYDVAPMSVILCEAGGRFSDFAGIDRADGGTALASNGILHDALLALVT